MVCYISAVVSISTPLSFLSMYTLDVIGYMYSEQPYASVFMSLLTVFCRSFPPVLCSMDRLHALRDTANLPRAVAPPLCPAHLSLDDSGRAEEMDDSGLDMKMDDSLTDMQWLQRMDAGGPLSLSLSLSYRSM